MNQDVHEQLRDQEYEQYLNSINSMPKFCFVHDIMEIDAWGKGIMICTQCHEEDSSFTGNK